MKFWQRDRTNKILVLKETIVLAYFESHERSSSKDVSGKTSLLYSTFQSIQKKDILHFRNIPHKDYFLEMHAAFLGNIQYWNWF